MGAEQSTETVEPTEDSATATGAGPSAAPTAAPAKPTAEDTGNPDSVLTKRLAAMEGAYDLMPAEAVINGTVPTLPISGKFSGLTASSGSSNGSTPTSSSRIGLLSSRTLAKIGSKGAVLLSWRPKSLTSSRGPVRGKEHNDPKRVFEGLQDLSVQAALNQPRQLKAMLQSISDAKAAINVKDSDGDRTPLHWAAARGHLRCIHALVDAGADKSLVDAAGQTPAQLASALGQDLAAELLEHGPPLDDPKAMSQHHKLMSHLSTFAALNQPTQLKAMIRGGAESVNAKDRDGDRVPLHWAAARGHIQCIEVLLSAGADLGAIDKDGSSAAGLALQCNQRTAHDLLLRAVKGEWTPPPPPSASKVKFSGGATPSIPEETTGATAVQSI